MEEIPDELNRIISQYLSSLDKYNLRKLDTSLGQVIAEEVGEAKGWDELVSLFKEQREEALLTVKHMDNDPQTKMLKVCLENYNSYIPVFGDTDVKDHEFLERKTASRLICYRYAGMGHTDALSVLKDTESDERFFISHLGGSNGWDRVENDRVYDEKTRDQLKLMTLPEAVKELLPL